MGITITTPKKKVEEVVLPKVETAPYIDPAELTLEQLADRYGELSDRIDAINMDPAFAQFEEVKKRLLTILKDELEAEQEATITGTKWLLEIGVAAKNSRKLKSDAVPVLIKMLGIETFSALAKVNISDVDKYCTPDQVAKVVDSDTGYSDKRKITAKHLG